jgi:hypothetical protein
MVNSNVTLHKLLVLTSASLLLVSNIAFAQIYKWQNARGVTQYSDTPPAAGYSKVTRNELVNAIQSKDVCTLANTKKNKATNVSATNMQSGTFVNSSAAKNNASSGSTQNTNKSDNTRSTGSSGSKSSSGGSSSAGSSGAGTSGAGAGTTGAGSANSLTKNDAPKSPTKLAQNNPAPTNQSAQGRETAPATTNGPVTKPISPVAANNSSTSATPPVQTVAQTAPIATPPKQTVAQAAPTVTPPKPIVVQAVPTIDITPPAPPTMAANVQAPNIVQVALMPAVDTSKNVKPAIGYSELRIQPTTEQPPIQGGAFRVTCTTSHMSNDDPLIYPNQPGAAHHHTFFGNTTTNAKSDLMTFSSTGNSTCNGGIMNRSAYWVPSMIDTNTNAPIVPDGSLFYYKTGDFSEAPSATITTPPKGLRMITGNAKATTADAAVGLYTCITAAGTTPWKPNIVNCAVGDTMQLHIDFPQCWDGVNLDSPDHKSHMSHRENVAGAPARCPSTHPVMIPSITLNINYKITVPNQTVNWRLASDNYATTSPGGYSTHADWVNGWDEKFMAGIIKNCLQRNADCHAHLLGDGRLYY